MTGLDCHALQSLDTREHTQPWLPKLDLPGRSPPYRTLAFQTLTALPRLTQRTLQSLDCHTYHALLDTPHQT